MTLKFKPKGYTGIRHETIGSDILALLGVLTMPEQVLGAERMARLSRVQAGGWYPIDWFIDLMEVLDEEVGEFALMRMGRNLFELSHQARVLEVASSARDIVFGIDEMYHHANRGRGIGGWMVKRFEPGEATLVKNTPHHCKMEQGILTGALRAVQCPSNIMQSACLREGDPYCVFEITSSVTDERWMGSEPG